MTVDMEKLSTFKSVFNNASMAAPTSMKATPPHTPIT